MLACPPAQWTSISLDSTPEVPKLTAEPAYIANKWSTTMVACADVGVASIVDESNQPLTVEAVGAMSFPDPSSLAQAAESQVEAGAGGVVNTASITQDIASLNNKVDEVAALIYHSVLLPCQAGRA